MKIPLSILLVFIATSPLFAQEPETPLEPEAPAVEKTVPDIYPRWSIAGEWKVTHPDWTDTMTYRTDGTYSTSRGSTGKWFFASDRGELVLVIRWDLFGTESLTMVGPDHFRGQKRKARFIDMRRGEALKKEAVEPKAAEPK